MLSALKLDYVQCPILCSVHKFKLWTFFFKRGSPPTNLWLYVVYLKTDKTNEVTSSSLDPRFIPLFSVI